jgi:hypothetical protein
MPEHYVDDTWYWYDGRVTNTATGESLSTAGAPLRPMMVDGQPVVDSGKTSNRMSAEHVRHQREASPADCYG